MVALPVRGCLNGFRIAVNRGSAGLRPNPSFLIAGAQRAGSTALYEYVCRHPLVYSASKKEIHYFDFNYGRRGSWYRAHFPPLALAIYPPETITGEASPYYMVHPAVPNRIALTCPAVKVVFLLRDPVDRAYSQYKHERKYGRESRPFLEAVNAELSRLNVSAFGKVPPQSVCGFGSALHRYSYITRGIYAPFIEEWLRHFPEEQVLCIRSEDLFSGRAEPIDEVWNLLGVRALRGVGDFPRRNETQGDWLSEGVYGSLLELYKPFDRQLRDLIGWGFYN